MKIGIITMHRVPNFGSALQAYALQHKLFQHGIDNKIIDYIYSYAGYEPSWGRYIYDKVKYSCSMPYDKKTRWYIIK